MKSSLLFVLLAATATVIPSRAATNVGLAPTGTPIMGYTATQQTAVGDSQTLGTSYAGGEGVAHVNDGSLTTYVDDFGNLGPFSYVGVTFSGALDVPVSSLNLYMYTFGDGGWFGPSGTGYDSGELDSSNLTAPIVQVTYDLTNWVTVASTNTYVTDLTGVVANQYAPETTFDLTSPVTDIEGIRLLGPNGGTATWHGNQGFIGVAELQVIEAPEPSTYALLAIGAAGLVFFARRRIA
jgi:hypothetical protein